MHLHVFIVLHYSSHFYQAYYTPSPYTCYSYRPTLAIHCHHLGSMKHVDHEYATGASLTSLPRLHGAVLINRGGLARICYIQRDMYTTVSLTPVTFTPYTHTNMLLLAINSTPTMTPVVTAMPLPQYVLGTMSP